MQVTPFTADEIESAKNALLAQGGLLATAPMTIGGVEYPHVFQLSAAASLRDLMAMKGMEHAANEFIVYGSERYTIAESWARSMRFAHWLIDHRGVKPGDRVGIAMRNYPEWCMAFIGVVASGATVVPLNSWWQADELIEGVSRARIKTIVCDDKRGSYLVPKKEELDLYVLGARETVVGADAQIDDILIDEEISKDAPAIKIDPQSDFCLLYTSGSTGKPKGALLTHQSVVNALVSWAFLLEMAQRLRPDANLDPDDPSVLLALPLFHVTALHSTLLLSWMKGRKTVFMYKWDAQEAVDSIKEEKITNFVGVPTMAHELISVAQPGDLATLADIITGGAKRPSTQVLAQYEKFPGIGISSGYGLTETNSLFVHITGGNFIQSPDATGIVVPPINEVACFDEDGVCLPNGEIGEICLKSPVTFRGYDGDEDATAKAFFSGGWFRTGDIGIVDENGMVTIVDRAKNLIIRGGENISCPEVENILLEIDGVDEAAVFSVPDEKLGEIVGAVVFGNGSGLDLAAIVAHAASKLAAFKVPERLWLSPQSLPRGGTGKTDRRQIKMLAMAHPAHWSAAEES